MDKSEARREQVLNAAAECFRQGGFHGTSIAQICKRAKMSPGHVYHYFENKEAIVASIAKREENEFSEVARQFEEDQAGGSVGDRMERQVASSVSRVLTPAYLGLHLELAAEATRNSAVRKFLQDSDEAVIDEFVALAKRVGLPEGLDEAEVELRMNMISAIFNGVMVQRATGRPMEEEQIVRLVRKLVLCLLEDEA